jgi:O-antigen/teichoic acid export membrane protein
VSEHLPNLRLIGNFGLLAAGEALSKVFGLAAFAYLARALGPGQFGELEFALALIVFFTLLVDGGLSSTGAREIARDSEAVGSITVNILVLRCVLALLALGSVMVFLSVLEKPPSQEWLIFLFGLTLLPLPGLLAWVFQGRDLMQCVAYASMLRWFIFACGVFILVQGPDQIWRVPVVEGIAILAAVFFYFRSFVKHFGPFRKEIDFARMRSLFGQAVPIGASELVWALKVYFATVLLGISVGGEEVGWFAGAHRIVVALHTFVWLYFFNLLPSLARSKNENPVVLGNLIESSLQVAGWASVFMVLLGLSLGTEIITLIYGHNFREAAPIFQVLMWLIPLALMSGHFRYTLIAHNRQRLECFSAAVGGAVNVALNLILNPVFGSFGAAWAIVASEAAILGMSYYFVRIAILPIPFWINLWRPSIAGVLLAAFCWFFPPVSIWITGLSAVVLYCGILAVMRPRIFADVRSMLVSMAK